MRKSKLRTCFPRWKMTRLACEDDAGAVVEAAGDGVVTDDVLAGGAARVLHVVQRPCHSQGPALGLGLIVWIGARAQSEPNGACSRTQTCRLRAEGVEGK